MKRQNNESIEKYRKRRKMEDLKTKLDLRGKLIWISREKGMADSNKWGKDNDK